MNKLHAFVAAVALVGCTADTPAGIARSAAADVTVQMDLFARPLPEIPLPNDLATRYDPDSPTGRRVNASLLAPTAFERRTRALFDSLDGWGLFAPITIPFTGPLDVRAIAARHVGDDYATEDDAVYLVDVTPASPEFGRLRELDIGAGNFPVALEEIDGYWEGDARGDTLALLFEEHDEDTDGDGELDPGEDVDLDGLLDKPNYFPDVQGDLRGKTLAERADSIVSFYERETHTLIARPLLPLRERTTYAVVVTRRVTDEAGAPVGSPFDFVNHTSQTEALAPVVERLEARDPAWGGLSLDDVAFAFTFTTGTVQADFVALRDGLYGHGIQAHLATEFPAEVHRLHEMFPDGGERSHENRYAMASERFVDILEELSQGGVVDNGEGAVSQRLLESFQYVDLHALGGFMTPRLMPGVNDPSNSLGWNQMVWPPDPSVTPVSAQPEEVTFWLTLPRKEISARGQGKPAPLMILGHGYGSSKTEVASFHGFFSRHGLAVLAIDNVSHGLGLNEAEQQLFDAVIAGQGLKGFGDALLQDRAWDQNTDGRRDSGADFWSAYAFHTRDVVRQTALDYVQLIRIVRSWDGVRTWDIDVNGNGVADDIAGDFDGDGAVDIGGPEGEVSMLGGSLGGIMTSVVGGIEPHLTSIVPIAGGGGLTDVGVRSIQGGVRESLQLRLMGPLYVGFPTSNGELAIQAVVPDLNGVDHIEVARLSAEAMADLSGAGAVVLAENLDNGEYDCARLRPPAHCVEGCDGDAVCEAACPQFRVAVASDMVLDSALRQRHRLTFYRQNVFQPGVRDEDGSRGCERVADAEAHVVQVIDRFGGDVDYHFRAQALSFRQGEPLSPLAEGLGLHRARPSLRRFVGFAQMALDPADPAVYAPHWQSDEMRFATGEVVQTRSLVLNTIGDMNVPVAGGAAIGRAAGLLDYKTPIAEWGGRTVNQVLIDTYVVEAVDTLGRFKDSSGRGVLFDPENVSGSEPSVLPAAGTPVVLPVAPRGRDGWEVPRLDPPLHTYAVGPDPFGGQSGTVFPFVIPTGKHGFQPPGDDINRLREACESARTAAGEDPAECAGEPYFDHALAIVGMAGRYLASGGTNFEFAECDWAGRCDDIPPPPAPRE